MKKKLLFIALTVASLGFFSCQKVIVEPQSVTTEGPSSGRTDICLPTEVSLIAGQNMNAGTVSVTNDADWIYVTYTTTGNWVITQTHLYVGDCNAIPVNNPGNPMPGQFPYGGTHSNVTTVTYQVPLSLIPEGGCGCIAAHCVVKELNSSGGTIQTQTGWGQGTPINLNGGNWGMKFEYCSCIPTP